MNHELGIGVAGRVIWALHMSAEPYRQLVRRLGRGISPSPAHRTTQTRKKRTQTSMPRVGFEPTIPVFEPVKTFGVLDRAVIATGVTRSRRIK
jgi:hypothetical protein